MSGAPAGYRLLPHTADVRLLAWGPTRAACLDQAVRALAAVFVQLPGEREPRVGVPVVAVPLALPPAADTELLVALLEEALFAIDVRGVVPVGAAVEIGPDGLQGRFDAVALADAVQVGSAPKAIARSGLEFAPDESGTWRALVTVDV